MRLGGGGDMEPPLFALVSCACFLERRGDSLGLELRDERDDCDDCEDMEALEALCLLLLALLLPLWSAFLLDLRELPLRALCLGFEGERDLDGDELWWWRLAVWRVLPGGGGGDE